MLMLLTAFHVLMELNHMISLETVILTMIASLANVVDGETLNSIHMSMKFWTRLLILAINVWRGLATSLTMPHTVHGFGKIKVHPPHLHLPPLKGVTTNLSTILHLIYTNTGTVIILSQDTLNQSEKFQWIVLSMWEACLTSHLCLQMKQITQTTQFTALPRIFNHSYRKFLC